MVGGLTKMSSASGTGRPNLACTLRVDGQDRVATRRQDAAHLVDRGAVQVAVDLRPLEQPAAVAKRAEVVAVEEVVVHPVDLALASLAGGGGHDRHDLRMPARELGDDGALADARRARHHHQHRVRERHSLLRIGHGLVGAHCSTSAPTPEGRRPSPTVTPDSSRQAARSAGSSLHARRRRPSNGRSSPRRDGMQELATEAARPLSPAVAHVAGDRQAEVGEMRSDLMGPPCHRAQGEQRIATTGRDHVVLGRRRAAAGHDRHPLPVARIASDRRLDPPARRRYLATHQRQVLLLDAPIPELAHQARLGELGLGHHDQPTGLLVEPMHDPRPSDAGDRAERLARSRDRPSSALTSVPVLCPAEGWTTSPAGLSTMSIVSSS